VIEGKFKDSERAKAIGFSHGDFSFVIEAFHDATGNQFLSPEVVED
jgi:hypothetical protein